MRLLIQEMIHSLRVAGWSIGTIAYDDPDRRTWIVYGMKDGKVIRAEGKTSAEAWYEACQQARVFGVLSPQRPAEQHRQA